MQTPNLYAPTVAHMPPERQTVINSGIALFELRWPKKLLQSKTVVGPFDIKVRELDMPGQDAPRYDYQWQTGERASIRFESSQNGVAWMPDDMFWHNRVYLMDNPWLNAVNLHTKESGIVPGSIVRLEVKCLQEEVKAIWDIWEIFRDGRPFDWRWNEKDANSIMEEYNTMQQTTKIMADGRVVPQRGVRYRYEIRPGKRLDYKKEVRELIQRYNRSFRYGWTEHPIFVKTIKPAVIKRINEKKQDAIPKSLTEDGVREVLEKMMKDGTLPLETRAKVKEAIDPTPHEEDPELYGGQGEGWLKMQRKDVLARIASDKGIDVEGKGKYDLITEILAKE